VAMLHDDKAGRNGPLQLISSSSDRLSQQVFETLPKCYPLMNFAHFNIILIPKHTSIPKGTHLRGATTLLRVCTLDFLLAISLNVKGENFTPIVIKGMYDYCHSNSTLNVKRYKNNQGNRIFGGEEDNTVSKSRETPPQTASDYWDRLTG